MDLLRQAVLLRNKRLTEREPTPPKNKYNDKSDDDGFESG